MIQDVVFANGPKAGKIYTLTEPTEVIFVPIIDRLPIATTTSTAMVMPTMRTGIYRVCRIPNSGHIMVDAEQRPIFEYRGER